MQKVGEPVEVYVSEMAYGLVLKKCCSFLEIWTSLSVKCTAVLSFKWRNASLFPDCVVSNESNSEETLCWLAGLLLFNFPQCSVCHILSIFVQTKEEPEIKARHYDSDVLLH